MPCDRRDALRESVSEVNDGYYPACSVFAEPDCWSLMTVTDSSRSRYVLCGQMHRGVVKVVYTKLMTELP